MQDWSLWHSKFGHPFSKVLKSLILLRHSKDLEQLNKFHVFPLDKKTRLAFPNSDSRAAKCFDVLYMDL